MIYTIFYQGRRRQKYIECLFWNPLPFIQGRGQGEGCVTYGVVLGFMNCQVIKVRLNFCRAWSGELRISYLSPSPQSSPSRGGRGSLWFRLSLIAEKIDTYTTDDCFCDLSLK
jgi:hypothetical protein